MGTGIQGSDRLSAQLGGAIGAARRYGHLPAARIADRRILASPPSGFIAWFAALMVMLLLVPAIVNVGLPAAASRIGMPLSAAAVLTVGFWLRPKPCLVALAFYILFYDTLAIQLGEGVKQVDELALPLMLAITLLRARPADWRLRPLFEIPLAIVVGAGLASSLLGGVPMSIWPIALFLLLKGIFVFYIASKLGWTREDVRSLLVIGLVIGVLVLAFAMVELVAPGVLEGTLGLSQFRARGGLPSLTSVFTHPVLFAWFTTLIGLYAFAGFLVTRRWWLLIVSGAFSLGVLLAARRKELIGLALSLVMAFVWHARATDSAARVLRVWGPMAIGAAIVVLLFLTNLTGLFELTLERYVDVEEPTDRARAALYAASTQVASDHFPFGVGLGRYGSWMSRVEYSPVYGQYGLDAIFGLRPDRPIYVTDTFWPQILGELGVVGLFGYVAFVGGLTATLWVWSRRETDPLVKTFYLGTFLLFVQSLVDSLATPMFVSPPRAQLLFMIVGIAVALSRRVERTRGSASHVAVVRRWGFPPSSPTLPSG